MNFAIEIEKLTKHYPGIKALDQITFRVEKGSVHGLLGPNGAGKTTAMNCLAGLIRPNSGKINVYGKIGYLPEIPPLYKDMVVGNYLSFIGGIYDLKGKKLKERVADSIEKVGIKDLSKRLIGNLSKGQRQRVGLASVLIPSPEILILDEPTVGLDPESIVEIRNLILNLKNDHTILLSTHQLREVELSCDTISIINKGKVVLTGPLSSIGENEASKAKNSYAMEFLNWDLQKEALLRMIFQEVGTEFNFNKGLDELDFSVNFSFEKNNQEKMGLLTTKLVQKGFHIKSLREEKNNLENIYLSAVNLANTRGGTLAQKNLSTHQ